MKHYVLTGALAATALATPAVAAETRLATHEFNGAAGSVPGGWTGNTGFQLGRGYMETAGKMNGAGLLNVELRTFNSARGSLFYQQSMRTTATYKPGSRQYIAIRARVRINHRQKGIVHGFFLYGQRTDGSGRKRQDEIDIEWLTNATSSTGTDTINISAWRDWNISCGYNGSSYSSTCGRQKSTTVSSGVGVEGWHKYEMKWFDSGKVEYYVDDKRVGTMNGDWVPRDRGLPVFLNSWAADSSWSDAYNSGLVTTNRANNKTYRMQVDWMTIDRGTY